MFFNILLSFKNIPELKVFIHILIFILMYVYFQHNLIRKATGERLDLPSDSQLHKAGLYLHLIGGVLLTRNDLRAFFALA